MLKLSFVINVKPGRIMLKILLIMSCILENRNILSIYALKYMA